MRPIVAHILLAAVGALFIYAGVMKAIDPAAFAREIESFQLLSRPAAAALALYLPWLEVLAGAAALTRRWAPAGRAVLMGLLVVFLGAAGSAWWRGLDVTCGCFGPAVNHTDYPWLIGRDVVLLAALALSAGLAKADNKDFSRPVAERETAR